VTDPDFPPVDVAAVRPSVIDVAILERTRTISAGGAELGTFDETTRPTAAEVEELIDVALNEVLLQIPANIDPAAYSPTLRLIALRAATLVEISFFRDQAEAAGGGTASTLNQMFQADLAGLLDLLHVNALRLP
jgi:hypothetical protein